MGSLGLPPNLGARISSVTQSQTKSSHTPSEHLSLFVVRTLILNDPVSYPPNEALTNNSVTDLIAASADFLSQSNAPALETLKMQVAAISAYESQKADAQAAFRLQVVAFLRDHPNQKSGGRLLRESVGARAGTALLGLLSRKRT